MPVSAATLKVAGVEFAEMALIATKGQYRSAGHAKVLMNVMRSKLEKMGVFKLLLPSARHAYGYWTTKHNFSLSTKQYFEGLKEMGYRIDMFPQTDMVEWEVKKGEHSELFNRTLIKLPRIDERYDIEKDPQGRVSGRDGGRGLGCRRAGVLV